MKCALEMGFAVAIKKTIEENEQRQKEEEEKKYQERVVEEKLLKFKEELYTLDALVEEELLKGNGKASIIIDTIDTFKYPKNYTFCCFSEKKKICHGYYWDTKRISIDFPLDDYLNYLHNHCYKTSYHYETFTGYSYTGKSSSDVRVKILDISI